MPNFGVPELLIILVIVAMLFGVGKLPQVFGAVGKGIKEFRRESSDVEATAAELSATAAGLPPTTSSTIAAATTPIAAQPPAVPAVIAPPVAEPTATAEQVK